MGITREAVERLYPAATFGVDFAGQNLELWNEAKLGPRPTEAQLDAAQAAVAADNGAFAQAVALLKQNYATMTPIQKALCAVLRRVVREMREDA